MKEKIYAVVGPTASGKTEYAIELAEKLDGEIVSCDSMQIYKYMDIGTAKPTPEERRRIRHHMIDIVPPSCNYSAADYVQVGSLCIEAIISRGKTSVLSGGTGLYVDSLLGNIKFEESERDDALRRELLEKAERDGGESVYDMLKEIDPESAEKIHPNNIKRVVRAIEIYKTTGKTKTQLDKESLRESKYDSTIIGMELEREILYRRINDRVDKMMDMGLLQEAKRIYDMGFSRKCTAMQAIGYKELFDYFDGESSLEEAVEKIKRESRRYAKRQITWFRRNPNINWIKG